MRLDVDDDVLGMLCEFGNISACREFDRSNVISFLQKNGVSIQSVEGGYSYPSGDEGKIKDLFMLERIRRIEEKIK